MCHRRLLDTVDPLQVVVHPVEVDVDPLTTQLALLLGGGCDLLGGVGHDLGRVGSLDEDRAQLGVGLGSGPQAARVSGLLGELAGGVLATAQVVVQGDVVGLSALGEAQVDPDDRARDAVDGHHPVSLGEVATVVEGDPDCLDDLARSQGVVLRLSKTDTHGDSLIVGVLLSPLLPSGANELQEDQDSSLSSRKISSGATVA